MSASGEDAVYRRGMRVLAGSLRASPWLYELMGTGTRDVGHRSYAVAVLSTEMTSERDRQRAGQAVNLTSEVGVRVLCRVRPDGVQADVADAYEAGVTAREALIRESSGSGNAEGPQSWRWLRSTTSATADGTYLLIEQRYTVAHHLDTV